MNKHISKNLLAATLAIIISIFIPASILADGGHGGGMGMGGGEYFDPDTIATLNGTLGDALDDWPAWGHGNHVGGGMHLEFTTSDGKHYELMLAPDWYLEELGIILNPGDSITITGSVIDADEYQQWSGWNGGHMGGGHMGGRGGDEDMVVVTELTVGGNTVQLRDERGYPLWHDEDGGWGGQWFDPDTVATYNGTLQNSLGMWSSWGFGNHTGNGMHYVFEARSGESFYAMLGPWWYLEDNGVYLEGGMKIKITGSVVEDYWHGYDDRNYLIATEIVVDGKTVQLRDEAGNPLWEGFGWFYHSPDFDSKSVGTVTGSVKRVRTRTYGKDLDPGYEMIIKTDSGRRKVFIAPQWHIENIDFSIAKNAEVTVQGSFDGKNIVAVFIKVDGKKWKFRSKSGTPHWIQGAN